MSGFEDDNTYHHHPIIACDQGSIEDVGLKCKTVHPLQRVIVSGERGLLEETSSRV